MIGRIALEDIEIVAYHGFYEEERIKGTKFTINLSFDTEITEAAQHDDLSGTVNYEEVYAIIEQEMKVTSKLIEYVAQRIITTLKNKLAQVKNIELKLSKHNPPIAGKVRCASVTVRG